MPRNSRLSLALLSLFVLSGFAGLIYQSVWTHYLGLTLGHAAYAQTLVLAIFMGGMAIGAWLTSRFSIQWRRLILGYAVVEGLIGVFGLLFHPLFVTYTGFSQETVLPALGNPTLAHAYQWLSAALLITPQSILLGATFPLMSAGLIRALPEEHGEVLGGLYFSNSLGAALGALLATFVLLPAVGLPGTVLTAGLMNILVALGAWVVSKSLSDADLAPIPGRMLRTVNHDKSAATEPADLQRLTRVLLGATAISAAASFVYEVGWVRLLNQALGSTIHSFELMLAAFILGLAFGGLWIRKRAKNIAEPVRYVGYVQVWMAIAALLSIPVFTQSFRWVEWIMSALSRGTNGYTLYELATAGIALLVMFPAAFLAGMTLPLFTLALLREGAGERAIGRIYAANTLGAIVGVAAMMHVLIPLIGVRLGVTLGALVDGLVGLYLLRAVNPAQLTKPVAAMAVAMLGALWFSVVMGRPDPVQQASGVFRTGRINLDGATVEHLRDGKTATIAVFSKSESKSIATNGKPDASLTPTRLPPTQDEITMVMAAVLPLALHPAPKRIAVIGWGSGLTTHTLLGSEVPEVVDTVEIERAMVDGAKLFGERVQRGYDDPRSKPRIEDARTFFSTGARKYDAIISEPSNPWVSGVASLFTREFYAFLRRHLNDGGMLVQWLHLYEIDDPLVGTMLAALVAEFPRSDLYLTNSSDLLIVGHTRPDAKLAQDFADEGSKLSAELRRVGVHTPDLIKVRRIGGGEVIRNFVRMTESTPHSDYFPTVSLKAPRTRFMQSHASTLASLVTNGMPVLDILDCRRPVPRSSHVPPVLWSTLAEIRQQALVMADPESRSQTVHPQQYPALLAGLRSFLASSQVLSGDPQSLKAWSEQLAAFARVTIGHLAAEDLRSAWDNPSWLPASALKISGVRPVMNAYSAAAQRAPVEMRAHAETVLALPASNFSPRMREQMLVIAMLGALGTGDPEAVPKLDSRWGPTLRGGGELRPIRSYLLAWAGGGVPACMARVGDAPRPVSRN